MKKILGSLLLIFVLVSFTGCKGGSSIVVDNPSDEISETLKLSEVKNGKALNVDKDTTAPYYDVKVSQTIGESLFYQIVDVDAYLGNEKTSINLKPLAFNVDFTNSANTTLIELIKILNDEKEGISKEDLGVELLDDEHSDYLLGKLNPVNNISIPSDIQSNSEDKVQLVVVYLPIYGIYYNSAENFTNIYLMVPVYYAFTTASNVTNYVGTMKNYKCVLTEVSQGNWVLPSKNN